MALIGLVAYNFVLFFPTLFMGRVVSPNDVFNNFDPWGVRPHVETQNSLINDPPTAYYTLMSLLRNDRQAFDWNPYVACGIPGYGSSAAAVLSPFIAIPVFLVGLTWVYTAIVFLKLNVAFLFAYLWLREERLGKTGAAVGALIVAGSGIVAVRWLWQLTNASALYPALLWIVRRAGAGKASAMSLVGLVMLAYALAGFPAAMAYGAWLCVAYSGFLLLRYRGAGLGPLSVAAVLALVALLAAAPSIVPFAQLVKRTGYLEIREAASLAHFYPLHHARAFVQPLRLGSPAFKNWSGDATLGSSNNFIEATIYVGLVAVFLIPLGLFRRRASSRWFWLAALLVIAGCMFGCRPFPMLIGSLPGFRYSPLTRVALLLVLPAGYLAGAGAAVVARRVRARRSLNFVVVSALAILTSGDLARFAGGFLPYLEPQDAQVVQTPVISYLRSQPGPFRIAPMFNFLWPNSSELFRLEDIRSHFSSEARYRALLARIDPTSFGGGSTVLQFNSLKFDFSDPLVSMLGVRYLIEHKVIDIVKWTVYAGTTPGVKETGGFVLEPGGVVQRTIRIDPAPFYAIEISAASEGRAVAQPRLDVSLLREGSEVWKRTFTPSELAVMNKFYVPVWPYARAGESVKLRLVSRGMRVPLLKGENDIPGESPLFYGRVRIPLIFDRELPDGRLFLNVAEIPRFHPVSSLARLPLAGFLARKDIDFRDTAVLTNPADPLVSVAAAGDARVIPLSRSGSEQSMSTVSSGTFFLASAEKLTPELRVAIDGSEVPLHEINLMFAGVIVPEGKHTVTFSRRIARGWWGVASLAMTALVALAIRDAAAAYRQRSQGRATRMIW